MSLAGVIDRFAQGTYSVTRGSAGSYVSGRWVPGSTSVVSIEACVQPVTGDALQLLPEGFHAENTRKLYTRSQLFTERMGDTGTPADVVSIAGESWKVLIVETWTRSKVGGDHYKVIVGRIVNA